MPRARPSASFPARGGERGVHTKSGQRCPRRERAPTGASTGTNASSAATAETAFSAAEAVRNASALSSIHPSTAAVAPPSPGRW